MDNRAAYLYEELNDLLLFSNQITSLELKDILRNKYPYYIFNQKDISKILLQLVEHNLLVLKQTANSFNIYKKEKSFLEIRNLLKNTKGKFITITCGFENTVINCNVSKDYVMKDGVLVNDKFIPYLFINTIKMNKQIIKC